MNPSKESLELCVEAGWSLVERVFICGSELPSPLAVCSVRAEHRETWRTVTHSSVAANFLALRAICSDRVEIWEGIQANTAPATYAYIRGVWFRNVFEYAHEPNDMLCGLVQLSQQ